MQGGAKTSEEIIQAVAFTKLLGFTDLVMFLKIVRRNFTILLRSLLEVLGMFWMFL